MKKQELTKLYKMIRQYNYEVKPHLVISSKNALRLANDMYNFNNN